MPKNDILISILNWNDAPATDRCLESLAKQTNQNFDVLVIDNASTDPYKAPVEVIRNSTNLGFAGGHDQAYKLAKERGYDYLLLLNNDTVCNPEMVGTMLKQMDKRPQLAALSPSIAYAGAGNRYWYAGGRLSLRLGNTSHLQTRPSESEEVIPVDFTSGGCLMIRLGLIEKLGLFDERYFFSWEDSDWCARAAKAGLQLGWLPKTLLSHDVSRSLRGSKIGFYYYFRNRLLFIKTHVPYGWRWLALSHFSYEALRRSLGDLLKHGSLGAARMILLGIRHHMQKRYGAFS